MRSQKGGVMLETSLVLPMLVLLLYGMAQIGSALREYQFITRIGYEMARYSASLPGLGPDGEVTIPCRKALNLGPSYSLLQERIQHLALQEGYELSELCKITLSVEERVSKSGKVYQRMHLRVSTPLENLLNSRLFMIMQIGTGVVGPYLFPDRNTKK